LRLKTKVSQFQTIKFLTLFQSSLLDQCLFAQFLVCRYRNTDSKFLLLLTLHYLFKRCRFKYFHFCLVVVVVVAVTVVVVVAVVVVVVVIVIVSDHLYT
jgi:hypothetical protein